MVVLLIEEWGGFKIILIPIKKEFEQVLGVPFHIIFNLYP